MFMLKYWCKIKQIKEKIMEWDYNKFSIEELETQYAKNKENIIYCEQVIKQKGKISNIILAVSFLITLGFSIAGITLIEDKLIKIFLSLFVLFSHVYCYMNINISSDYKSVVNDFIKENEKIELVYNIKTNKKINYI